jgi:hypothetical protein
MIFIAPLCGSVWSWRRPSPIIALQGIAIDLNSPFLGNVQEWRDTPRSAQFISPLSSAIHYIARLSVIFFLRLSTSTDLRCPSSTFSFAHVPPFRSRPSTAFFGFPKSFLQRTANWTDLSRRSASRDSFNSVDLQHPLARSSTKIYDYSAYACRSGTTFTVVENEGTCGFGSCYDGDQEIRIN